MKKRFLWLKETLSHISAKMFAGAFAVFFVVIVITAYTGVNVYQTEKKVLLQQGELNAKEAATEYNRILLNRVNIVTLSGCAVEHMLEDGEPGAAIEKYMAQQTRYIIETFDPSTTGLYGWIGGAYLDGSGWVPDAHYAATERPWYIQTVNSNREITFVEPYLDMQTETVMMTVSRLLNDRKSVIAMDVSLDPLQAIVRQVASAADGSKAFVLDVSGIVVAHSDPGELGRNYLASPGTTEYEIANRILSGSTEQFDLKTSEGSFSVYVDELLGGWYSVSLINSGIFYRPLKYTMGTIVVILLIVAAFLILVFLHLIEENRTLEMLHTKINQEEKRGNELQILSETDRMTGLFDRTSGKRRVDDLLASGTEGMFLEFDIDRFKSINDTYGHQAGDQVILAVADALRQTFRSNDVTMRLGGDEFGVFAVGIVRKEMAESIVNRLFSKLDTVRIKELNGNSFSISIGAVLYGADQKKTFDDLYALADSAMYTSKKKAGNSLTFSE